MFICNGPHRFYPSLRSPDYVPYDLPQRLHGVLSTGRAEVFSNTVQVVACEFKRLLFRQKVRVVLWAPTPPRLGDGFHHHVSFNKVRGLCLPIGGVLPEEVCVSPAEAKRPFMLAPEGTFRDGNVFLDKSSQLAHGLRDHPELLTAEHDGKTLLAIAAEVGNLDAMRVDLRVHGHVVSFAWREIMIR